MLTSVNKRRLAPLDAALAVLRRDGPDALTMRSVAAEAGVTATALYRHFDDKEDLLRAVVREVYRVFLGYLAGRVAGDDPVAWLRVGADRYLRFALEHRGYYRLLFVAPHGIGIDRFPDDFARGKSAGFRQLKEAVEAGMARGALRPGDPAEVALTLYAHMHGLVMLHYAGRFAGDDTTFGEFYHRSLEHVLTGLR